MAKRGHKKKPALRAAGPAPHRLPAAGELGPEVGRGLAAFQRGDYDTAIQVWQRVRRPTASPGQDQALAEAHFRRAIAATNPARRLQDLQEAVALCPGSAVYHFHLGLAHQHLGQSGRALAALEAAHRLAPGDARTRRHLALLLLGAPSPAARVYDLLAGAPGQDEAAVRLRALAALRSNQPGAAVTILKERASPTPLARLSLGVAYLAAGQVQQAIAVLAGLHRSRQSPGIQTTELAALAFMQAQLRAGNLGDALDLLRHQAVPDNAVSRRALAAASRELGAGLALDNQIDQATLAYEQALMLEPDDAEVRGCVVHLHEVLGTRAACEGDMARAAAHWQAALDLLPENARLLHNLALAEERLERWRQAGAHWEQMVRLWRKESTAPRRSDAAAAERRRRLGVAYSHLAATQQAAGDLRAAARTLDHALNFDVSDVDLRLRAAALHLDNGDYSSAIDHLRRALAARPEDIQILVELGSAYTWQENHRQALVYLERALALEPGNPAVTAALAEAHHGCGHELDHVRKWEQAAAEFQRAASLAPDDPEHLKCLGGVYLELHRPDAARSAFDSALALHPTSAPLLVAIGGRYLAYGSRKDAEGCFWQALRIDRSPAVQIMIGTTYLENDDLAGANRYFKGLLKAREPALMLLIADALLDSRHDEAAIPYLERAVALDRSNPAAHSNLAMAYTFGRGDFDRAERELSAAEDLGRAQQDQEVLAMVAEARRGLALLRRAGPVPGRLELAGMRP